MQFECPKQAQTTCQRAIHQATSECSLAGTWNKGTTDVINLEILSFNGQDFKGTYKRPEALYIGTNVLGQDGGILHGISFKSIPRRPLQIVYRLKQQVNIDEIFSHDDFSYNRGEQKVDGLYNIVCGRILGLRKPRNVYPQPSSERRVNPTRINLYGCDFDLTKEQIFNWMSKFGQ